MPHQAVRASAKRRSRPPVTRRSACHIARSRSVPSSMPSATCSEQPRVGDAAAGSSVPSIPRRRVTRRDRDRGRSGADHLRRLRSRSLVADGVGVLLAISRGPRAWGGPPGPGSRRGRVRLRDAGARRSTAASFARPCASASHEHPGDAPPRPRSASVTRSRSCGRVLERQVQDVIAHLASDRHRHRPARAVLRQELEAASPAAAVGRRLGLSERSLHRRLREEE